MKTIIIRVLVMLALAPLLVEGLLRLFDPLGAAYFFDLEALGRHSIVDDTRGYILAPGTVHLRRWSVTELPAGERYTPASRPDGCTLLILGDSLAFGQGVNDDETFANILAQQLGLHVVNAAFEGYNSAQVLATLRQYPQTDVVVYLLISNDMDPAGHFEQAMDIDRFPMLSLYTMGLRNVTNPPDGRPDAARFWSDMASLVSDPRVTVVAFDEPFGRLVAERAPVRLIPSYAHHVSFFDGHPDAAGHQEIAASMLPLIRQAVSTHCTALF